MPETRYVRYVKTVALTELLKHLKSEQVLRLLARRTYQDPTGDDYPLRWVHLQRTDRVAMAIDFLSLRHGRFQKRALLRLIQESGCKEASVQEIDVFISRGPIGDAFAELVGDDGLRRYDYVAHFEEYPIRRERKFVGLGPVEDNEFIRAVRKVFADQKLGELRFELASLDLMYALPVPNWRDMARTRRLTGRHRNQMEQWKTDFARLENSAIRRLALAVFPKDLCSGRQYRRVRGDVWRLVRHGDI